MLRTNRERKDRERKGLFFLISLSKTGERRIDGRGGQGSLGCWEEEEEKRRGSFCL